MKTRFTVTGMACAACSARVQRTVEKLPGVRACAVNLLKNSMEVDYDGTPDVDGLIGLFDHARHGRH